MTCSARKRHRHYTILVDTPLGLKHKPSIRGLLIGIRAMAACPRGVPARELARDLGINHVTLWRHLHTVRVLLPPPPAWPTELAAQVQVCRRTAKRAPAWLRAGASTALAAEDGERAGGRDGRLVAESVRTLINGTFRGVGARWLMRYAEEAAARWSYGVDVVAGALLRPLVAGGAPLSFKRVARCEPRAPPLPLAA